MPTEDDPAERKSRHLTTSQEIQLLGMSLVRQTAAKAEEALNAPDPDPEDPPVRTPDHVLEFVRLARLVNHSMAFETRTAHGEPARGTSAYRPATPRPAPPDPRRPLVGQALHRASDALAGPDRARRRRAANDQLEAELAADPDQTRHPVDLLVAVADAAQFPIDTQHLSDELLHYQPAANPDLSRTAAPTPYRPAPRQNL